MLSYLLALQMLAALLIAHVLADYPLQGDFISRAKNASAPLPGVPWRTILASHALIHGGAVWGVVAFFLGVSGVDLRVAIQAAFIFGIAEFVAHALIDHLKCTGRFGAGAAAFNFDQLLHFVCKVLWVAVLGAVRWA